MHDDTRHLAAVTSSPARPWWPYKVPEDVSDTALAVMSASALVLAFQDTTIAAQRAATVDEHVVDADLFDVLVDTRDRLAQEVHTRLLEVEHQTEYRRLRERAARPRLVV